MENADEEEDIDDDLLDDNKRAWSNLKGNWGKRDWNNFKGTLDSFVNTDD